MRQLESMTLNNGRAQRPKGVNRILQKDKRGYVIGVQYYHRNGGRIHGELNSEGFLENYLKLQKGVVPKSDGSLHGLVTEYLASPEFEKLAPKSKELYRYFLDMTQERWSALQIVDLEDDGMAGLIFD